MIKMLPLKEAEVMSSRVTCQKRKEKDYITVTVFVKILLELMHVIGFNSIFQGMKQHKPDLKLSYFVFSGEINQG